MNNLTLTTSQEEALQAVRSFLNDDETPLFVLNGAAGTGKTTLIRAIIAQLEKEDRPYKLMAPTGRAAHILSQRTNQPASTIHRGIYKHCTVGEPTSTSKEKLKAAQPDQKEVTRQEDKECLHFLLDINENPPQTVYIVDEASMIADNLQETETLKFGSGRLLTDLLNYTGRRKVIFVGDQAQLPPVGMRFSPVFDSAYLLKQHGRQMKQYDLREIIRQQADSTILKNAMRIRQQIDAHEYQNFRLEQGQNALATAQLLPPYFELFPSRPHPQAIVIAYSNRQVLDYNHCIREHYYGTQTQWLNAGELLMIARNNYSYGEELYNGSFVRVDEVMNGGQIEHRRVKLHRENKQEVEVDLQFGEAKISFRKGNEAVTMVVKLLVNSLNTTDTSVSGKLLAQALLVEFKLRLPPRLRNLKKTNPQYKQLRKEYTDLLMQDRYYNALNCKYGYAITCHKAQGGEWTHVFVDMGRYGGTANEDYFRWAYTALTRSKQQIWHCNAPEFDYISKLKVEEIQRSAHLKVSVRSEGTDFRTTRIQKLRTLCEKAGIEVTDDLTFNYEHRLTFTNQAGTAASFTLWYNKNGYSGKQRVICSEQEEFTQYCQKLLEQSTAPQEVEFAAPDRPFAEKLVKFVKSQLQELDIQLLDITQEQYQDIFHLQTDGLSKLCLNYTQKGIYTYLRLQSTLGTEDRKLAQLRERFL